MPNSLLRRASLLLIVAAWGVAAAACSNKKDQPQQTQTGPGGVQINGGSVTPANFGDVTRYSDEGPETGTVLTKRVSIVRKSADPGGEILARVGPGTAVNKRARHGPYYLIEYPTGPGEMKPGWVLQDDVNTSTAVATAVPTTTTRATATVTTTNVPPGGRPPPIRIGK